MTGLAGTVLGLIPGLGWLAAAKRFLAGIFGPFWRWLTADWRNGPLFMLALLAAAHLFIIDPDLRDARDKARTALADEKSAHAQTIASHRKAAAAAEKAQEANIGRVEAEQDAISERIEHDFQDRIAALGARAERLRAQASARSGLSSATGLSGAGARARSAAEAAGDHGFSPAGDVCEPMNLEERIVATEQAIQLDALIGWTIEQAAVLTSPIADRPP